MSWPNRTGCDVLEEMRKCHSTRNYASLLALVEEMQSIANRMEAGLEDKRDVRNWKETRKELKDDIRRLRDKKRKLERKVHKMEEQCTTTDE